MSPNRAASKERKKSFVARCMLALVFLISLFVHAPQAQSAETTTSPLVELPSFKSENGVLTATLVAGEQKVQLGAVSFDGLVYNGSYAAPVFYVHPGDVMKIKLVNNLKIPTNLHFHGFHSSPLGNGDNIHIVVNQGQSFDYEIKLPLTQPPGVYWYHAHIHGMSELQIGSGLSGTVVVEGI